MGDHIPNSPHNPTEEPMYDKNGFQLKVGDSIAYSGGRGRIVEYLGDGGKFGARVRLINTKGQRVDVALLLDGAEYKRAEDADEEDPSTPPYGM